MLCAMLQLRKLGEKLSPDWHGDFCRSRRRRCPQVRRVVDQGGIGFVTDCRDKRYRAFGRGSDHFFFVEGPQILDRAAAPRDDEQVRLRLN